MSNSNPHTLIHDIVVNLTEIASYLFRQENITFAVHGSKNKFKILELKLEMLLNQIKNENSRFSETHPDLIKIPSEFEKQIFHQTYFKTPLAVNNCVESMLGPTYADQEDYGVGLVASELMTFSFLLPSIREKGGAYGAGCKVNESGLIGFYSFRDPKVKETYDNFEKAVNNVLDGNFGDREMQESKLLAFQKLDKVLEPSLKGLI